MNDVLGSILNTKEKERDRQTKRDRKKEKEISKSNRKNIPLEITKNINRYFTKEDIQMAYKLMKRCSTSLVIKGNTS